MPIDIAQLAARCRASLDRARPGAGESAPFRQALAAQANGRHDAAAEALAPLGDLELLIATQFLQLEYLNDRSEGAADLGPLNAQVQSRLKPGAVDVLSDLARHWLDLWIRRIGRHFSPDVLTSFGGSASELVLETAAKAAARAGDATAALAAAERIGRYHLAERARAFATLGVALNDPAAREQALATALDIPLRDFIQDGGEESEAYADVLDILAAAGLPADHPAVAKAFDSLARLGVNRATKDARSYGLKHAAVSAAEHAAATQSVGWLDRAAALVPLLHTEELQDAAALAIALSHRSLGNHPRAIHWMEQVRDAFLGGPALAAQLRQPFSGDAAALSPLIDHASPFYLVIAADAVGHATGDTSLLTAAFEFVAPLAESRYASRTLVALKLALGYDGHDTLGANFNDDDRTAATTEAVLIAARLPDPARASALFARLDITRITGVDVEQLVTLLDPPALAQIERVFANPRSKQQVRARPAALTALAARHLADDRPDDQRWNDARRCIEAAISTIAADPDPVWTPFYRRGDRANPSADVMPLTPGTPLEIPWREAIKQAERSDQPLEQLHALAPRLIGNAEALALLITRMTKAKTERDRDSRAVKTSRIAHVHLLADQPDLALALAVDMPDCRRTAWGPAAVATVASQWFAGHPAYFTTTHANQLLAILNTNVHPQDLPNPILVVGAQILGSAPPEQRAGLSDQILALKRHFRFTGDQSICHAALALAAARLNDAPAARARLAEALALLDAADAIYHPEMFIVGVILDVSDTIDLPDRTVLLARVLRTLRGHNWEITMSWERLMLRLFQQGDQTTLPALLELGGWPSEVVEQVKRSWRVEALGHAARPVDALLSLFDDVPKNWDQAIEQIVTLSAALEKDRAPEAAAALCQLLQ